MGVSIRDILKLPCMRGAEVLAGEAGLDRMVSAVSVLEYSEPTKLQENLLNSTCVYGGSELIISALVSAKDDVEAQCCVLRRLSETGGVGMLLYYVGIFLQTVDRRLLQTADELGFVLICMPPGRRDLRYSEAITEIQSMIFQDQQRETKFFSPVLNQILSLDIELQNADTLLRMISDRLQLTVVLTDHAGRLLHYAAWPSMTQEEILDLIGTVYSGADKNGQAAMADGRKLDFKLCRLQDQALLRYQLLLFGVPDKLCPENTGQIAELVTVCLKMWEGRESSFGLSDFIHAVMRDEPVKMRQLARMLGINAESIHNMILAHPLQADSVRYQRCAEVLKHYLKERCRTKIVEIYEAYIVVLVDNGISDEWVAALFEMNEQLRAAGLACRLLYSCDLDTTQEVRSAYLNMSSLEETATQLYRKAEILSTYEIGFAGQCRKLIEQGEDSLDAQMTILKNLKNGTEAQGDELVETLACFYFDAHMSVAETARQMFLHPNTIKYRLAKIGRRIGCRVTDMPEMMELYRAAALDRLLKS